MLANLFMLHPEAQKLVYSPMSAVQVTATEPAVTFDLNALTSSIDRKFTLPGNNSEVSIKVGENPTTGYTWTVDSSNCGARLTEVKSHYTRASDSDGVQMGVGGTREWIFKTPDPAENYVRGLPCDLNFSLSRPWEKENGAVQTESVTVTIN